MPLFDYTGQLPSGGQFHGTLEAESHEQAQETLDKLGVRVISLRTAKRNAYVAPLSLDEFTFFNEQLEAMTKAGIPLEEGLRQLASDVGSRKLKRLLLDLAEDLASGTELQAALDKHKRRFPPQYADVVGAGIQTGDLAGTLYGLTTHLRLKSTARRTMLELAVYPILVLVLATYVVSFIMRAVLPTLEGVMKEMVSELQGWNSYAMAGTPADAFIFDVARAWPAIEVSIIGLLAVVVLIAIVVVLPGMTSVREALLRRLPGFAQLYWSSVLSRFAHTSALAAYSGTPLPDLVASAGVASGSPALTRATRRVADRLANGDSIEGAVKAERDVPALWTCAVSIAAPRGDLPGALAELARAYELRADQWITTLRAVIAPLLFLIVAVTIGSIVVGILSVVASFLNIMLRLTTLF